MICWDKLPGGLILLKLLSPHTLQDLPLPKHPQDLPQILFPNSPLPTHPRTDKALMAIPIEGTGEVEDKIEWSKALIWDGLSACPSDKYLSLPDTFFWNV
ncbi:unnamed protein product [Nezara viridula]|uniref:Uncharacterized protein n=1 Tax=Nezara viridula TaxID=85310 RepID=A0A9P0MM58_NEZVI|nr:unnamed protein product [Nezara viridula]